MKKTLTVMLMVLLAAILIVSCSNSSKKVYTVTFDANDGSGVTAVEVKEGEKAPKPADPTYAGHVFKYWSLNGTDEYDFNTAITEDITLKSVWFELPTFANAGDTNKLGTVIWQALSVDTDKKQALLISKDVLEKRAFDSDNSNAYQSSSIRAYLNGDFISDYGLSKDYIKRVDVTTDIEKTEIKDSGEDYVFLLSKTEASNDDGYFDSDEDRIAKYNSTNTGWWLRTPYTSDGSGNVCNVTFNGDNTAAMSPNKNNMIGLRPAFWYTWN